MAQKKRKEEVFEPDLTNTENYRNFMRIALKQADRICLTYNLGYKDFVESEWNFLVDSLVSQKRTERTYVTIGSTHLMLFFDINKTTTDWLMEKYHIYDFVSRDPDSNEYLEDLALVKNDEAIFASCTHEEFFWIDEKLEEALKNSHKFI